MISEIASLIASSKAAYDIAKGLTSVHIDDKIRERTADLLGILLAVQSDALIVNAKHQELLKLKYDLEKKILEFENWSETERQYELKEVAPGIFVYAYKKTVESAEPMHWLCTNCWKDRIKSIIQKPLGDSYTCPKCKTELYPFLNKRHSDSTDIDYDPFHN